MTVEFKRAPEECASCQDKEICVTCFKCPTLDVNFRYLILYTKIPELWKIFSDVLALNNVTEAGFTLFGIGDYMRDYPYLLQVTHNEFWSAMRYFLYRVNNDYQTRLAAKRSKLNG